MEEKEEHEEKSSEERTLLCVSVNNSKALRYAIKGGADVVYVDSDAEMLENEEWSSAIALATEKGIPLYLHTPVIVKDREMGKLRDRIEQAKKLGFSGIIVANLGVLRMILGSVASDMKILTDSSMNVFNRNTLEFFTEKGADTVTLSVEMNLGQITKIAKYGNCEYIVHGGIQVMESEHCLIAGILGEKDDCGSHCKSGKFELVDEKGYEFLLRTDSDCRTHIYNSRELCLLEEVPQLIKAGVSRLRIDARTMKNEHIEKATRAYRDGIDSYFSGNKKQAWQSSDISEYHTRGHYHRGVL